MTQLSLYLFTALLMASIYSWRYVFRRLALRQAPIAAERRRDVPWSVIDLMFAAYTLTCFMAAAIGTGERLGLIALGMPMHEMTADGQVWLMLADASAKVAAAATLLGWLIWRVGANGHDLGLRPLRIGYDLRLGLATFSLLAPIAFAIKFILTRFFDKEHPLIETLQVNPSSRAFLAATLVTVVIAPIVEEFVFRVFLQGWLEKLFRQLFWPPSTGMASAAVEFDAGQSQNQHELVYRPRFDRPWILSVAISSALFAALHSDHGAAPFPLFVIACGLGHLYLCTHRILPCIVMHAALNGYSMVVLWLSINQPK